MTTNCFEGQTMTNKGVCYYLDPISGAMADRTWLDICKNWYYFCNDNGDIGKKNTGHQNIDGKQYKFDQSGKWIQ